MKRKTIEKINEALDLENEAFNLEFIFKCLQSKGYSPRGGMTMAEPYITFVYKGEYYRITCCGCIVCTIYKTFPIKETDISAAKDIISKIMLDNPTVRVMLRDDDRDRIGLPMDEKLIFAITWYPACNIAFADDIDYYLTDLQKAISHRIFNGRLRRRYTNYMDKLEDDEVLVFGSDLQGFNSIAAGHMFKLGVARRLGIGFYGQSYAIPTMQGGVETIKPYVDEFITFAKEHTELYFYVTRIGCGIAGSQDKEIAPLFKDASELVNVALPESFVKYINQ